MKKMLVVLSAALLFFLVGCGDTSVNSEPPAGQQGGSEGESVASNAKAATDTLDKDDFFIFKDGRKTASPGAADWMWSFVFSVDAEGDYRELETKRGVRVGDSYSRITDAYGGISCLAMPFLTTYEGDVLGGDMSDHVVPDVAELFTTKGPEKEMSLTFALGVYKDGGTTQDIAALVTNGATASQASLVAHYMLAFDIVDGYIEDITVSVMDYEVYASMSGADNDSQPPVTVIEENPTTGQANALKKAESYLSVLAFSPTSLAEQLRYEGFLDEEVEYAVANCGADWNAQAAKKAKSYLNGTAFSRAGLIEQLQFEGFTYEQAVYGVEQNGY